MNKNLKKAVKIVREGGIIIFPTDTAFGIGCRIDNKESVKRLFKLRRRPEEKAVPILASSIEMVKNYVEELDKETLLLMQKTWPGGLTVVLNCNEVKIPSVVRGGGKTIGIRIPKHNTVREMIKEVGVPIVGCSANFAGEDTPYKVSDLNPDLIKLVDFVLTGRCSVKKASTVLDVTRKQWKILRQGAVTI